MTTRLRTLSACLLTLGVAGAGGWIARAAIPSADGTIHACYPGPSGGQLRIIDDSATCSGTEQSLVFNQKGPQGPAGPQGAMGPGGPAGAAGAAGKDGTDATAISLAYEHGPTSAYSEILNSGGLQLRARCASGQAHALPQLTAKIAGGDLTAVVEPFDERINGQAVRAGTRLAHVVPGPPESLLPAVKRFAQVSFVFHAADGTAITGLFHAGSFPSKGCFVAGTATTASAADGTADADTWAGPVR
jgi:hypothetical protein